MKILKIHKCGDPECPFFKCISDDENGYVGLCNIEKRYITELDRVPHKDSLWYESDVISKPGVIPEWCPLENEMLYREWLIDLREELKKDLDDNLKLYAETHEYIYDVRAEQLRKLIRTVISVTGS